MIARSSVGNPERAEPKGDAPPTLSVIVAAYNVAQYIVQCLESVLGCAGPPLEIIVVDDASSDATVETVNRRFAEEPRVKVLRLGVNRGPSQARNVAIESASGQWLALVDADDWCANDRFVHLLDAARRFDADIVSDDEYLIEDGSRAPWSTVNRVSHWTQNPLEPVTFERFFASGHIVKPLIKRSFLKAHGVAFNEGIRHGEDFLLFNELLLAGAKWHMIQQPLYYYRQRSGSLTNTGEFSQGNVRVLEHLVGLNVAAANERYAELCSRTLERFHYNARVRAMRTELRRGNLRALGRSLTVEPTLIWSLLRQEASLAPLRVRRGLHRLRFG